MTLPGWAKGTRDNEKLTLLQLLVVNSTACERDIKMIPGKVYELL